MGKRDDWCSSKGINNRKKGMYEKESKCRKVSFCILFGLSAAYFFGVGVLYATRASNAEKINADYSTSDTGVLAAKYAPKCDNGDLAGIFTNTAGSLGGGLTANEELGLLGGIDDWTLRQLKTGRSSGFSSTNRYYDNNTGGATISAEEARDKYKITLAYDSCQFPTFDVLGFNNPCPTLEESLELVGRLEEMNRILKNDL